MSSPSDSGSSDSGASDSGESSFDSEPMLGVADWTELPTEERRCLRWMLRTGEVTTEQTMTELEMDEESALAVLEGLVARKLAIFIDEKIVYTGNVGGEPRASSQGACGTRWPTS